MRLALNLITCAAGAVGTACHGTRVEPPQTSTTKTALTVFTDSATHARLCQPAPPEQDWRTVCIPLDQGVDLVTRKP